VPFQCFWLLLVSATLLFALFAFLSCSALYDSVSTHVVNACAVQVLVDRRTGILRSGKFADCTWAEDCHPVAMTDVLRVHAWKYVKSIREACAGAPEDGGTRNIDSDTAVSRGSFRAALKAAGSVCAAVDDVVAGRVCSMSLMSIISKECTPYRIDEQYFKLKCTRGPKDSMKQTHTI
jgi:hypothetical protein